MINQYFVKVNSRFSSRNDDRHSVTSVWSLTPIMAFSVVFNYGVRQGSTVNSYHAYNFEL